MKGRKRRTTYSHLDSSEPDGDDHVMAERWNDRRTVSTVVFVFVLITSNQRVVETEPRHTYPGTSSDGIIKGRGVL